MKIIAVSGTPGTGKSTLAKELAVKLGYTYIDVSLMVDSVTEEYDEERDCAVVDVGNLTRRITEELKGILGGAVVDSHLSHYLSPKLVSLCIITKCGLKELKKRLEKRGYSERKVRENLDAEIFDTCRVEAIEEGHKVEVVETDKPYSVDEIIKGLP